MSLTESDIELLETYLDGELPITQAEDLWRRLATEPELAAELRTLRLGRTERQAAWAAVEPTDEAAEICTDRVVESIRRRESWQRLNRGLRYLATAAACLFLGFRAGWIEHGDGLAAAPAQSPAAATVALSNDGQSSDAPSTNAPANVYPVAIRDQRGNLIAVQKFDSSQDAADFVNDLNQSQAPSRPRDLGQNVVPASYEQF